MPPTISAEKIFSTPKVPLWPPWPSPSFYHSQALLSALWLCCSSYPIFFRRLHAWNPIYNRSLFLAPVSWHKVWESLMHCTFVVSFSPLLLLTLCMWQHLMTYMPISAFTNVSSIVNISRVSHNHAFIDIIYIKFPLFNNTSAMLKTNPFQICSTEKEVVVTRVAMHQHPILRQESPTLSKPLFSCPRRSPCSPHTSLWTQRCLMCFQVTH